MLLPHLAIDEDRLGQRLAAHVEASPARSTAARKALARSAVSAPRSVGAIGRLHAAGLDAREVEQVVHQLQQAQLRCGARSSGSRPRASRRSSASSVGPSISVSGVRNSWLTLLKKAVLARSIAASASARRCCC